MATEEHGLLVAVNVSVDRPQEEIDGLDAESLYEVLTREVIPSFYERDGRGIPKRWIARMRSAMRTIVPVYNTHRMVTEYAEKYYFPKKSRR